MDNLKTGNLIKETRKEKGLTQKELADRLHITDRAVSKWERGICAPDIALLEPLAAICAFDLWYKGYFHIIGRYPSPDGSTVTTVYGCYLAYGAPPEPGSFTLSDEGRFRGRITYGNLAFRGCWWSPDGSYQVISTYSNSTAWSDAPETILFLTDYTRNVSSNLDIDLDRAIYNNDFFADAPDGTIKHEIEFEFIQWSQKDPAKMLVYFSYTDTSDQFHEGYMWYDYESGKSYGEMEIEQGEKDPDPLRILLISPFTH